MSSTSPLRKEVFSPLLREETSKKIKHKSGVGGEKKDLRMGQETRRRLAAAVLVVWAMVMCVVCPVVCGVWCVVCCVLCVVCGVWCGVCGFLFVLSCVLCVVCCVVCGAWCLVCGVRGVMCDVWCVWRVVCVV